MDSLAWIGCSHKESLDVFRPCLQYFDLPADPPLLNTNALLTWCFSRYPGPLSVPFLITFPGLTLVMKSHRPRLIGLPSLLWGTDALRALNVLTLSDGPLCTSWLPYSFDNYLHAFVFVFVSCVSRIFNILKISYEIQNREILCTQLWWRCSECADKLHAL